MNILKYDVDVRLYKNYLLRNDGALLIICLLSCFQFIECGLVNLGLFEVQILKNQAKFLHRLLI